METITHLISVFEFVLKGVTVTLEYTVLSAIGGFLIGLLIALMNVGSRPGVRTFARIYTSIFRGTPMLLQLSIVYFGIPSLTAYKISPLLAGVIAFSLNSAAYVAEVLRAGIQAIDVGQFEASNALNIPRFLMMKDIILPQAFRNTLPALVNEVINLLKETALISTLGEGDIIRRAQLIAAETYTYFEPLMMAALCYYGIVLLLSACVRVLERRLGYATN